MKHDRREDWEWAWLIKGVVKYTVIAGGFMAVIVAALMALEKAANTPSERDTIAEGFRMVKVAVSENDRSFQIFEDTETGVQYIVYINDKMFGLSPRYHADGTLYNGKDGRIGA